MVEIEKEIEKIDSHIDKRFKKEMEEFERIKLKTSNAIKSSHSKLGQR